ncbi:hypothetical protein JXL83_04930 [candidate division WOR-3 bacterium]|nr:hypothetical protein [candidate division WOR-3 bacterium]
MKIILLNISFILLIFQQLPAEYTDTLTLEACILNSLPIGWGTLYQCEIHKIIEGEQPDIDSVFTMSASVGGEHIYEDVHFLSVGEIYLIKFVKTDITSDKPYIPAGTTGFVDKNGFIWIITELQKTE